MRGGSVHKLDTLFRACSISSFLLEQNVIEKSATHDEIMVVKLHSAMDPNITK